MKSASDKPMLPATPVHPKGFVQCAANPKCRYPGRLWLVGMEPNERVCVEHYSRSPRRFAKESQ